MTVSFILEWQAATLARLLDDISLRRQQETDGFISIRFYEMEVLRRIGAVMSKGVEQLAADSSVNVAEAVLNRRDYCLQSLSFHGVEEMRERIRTADVFSQFLF